jgi:hypothetical protein
MEFLRKYVEAKVTPTSAMVVSLKFEDGCDSGAFVQSAVSRARSDLISTAASAR